MYELTPILTTIATASASIVAILGGFIASKLIAISSERNEAINRLSEIDEEIVFRQAEVSVLSEEVNEEDALDFILSHIKELFGATDVAVVYDAETLPNIELNALTPYWDKGVAIAKDFYEKYTNDDSTVNEDGIPSDLAAKYKRDSFGYTICEELARFIKREYSSSNGLFSASRIIEVMEPPRIRGAWYFKSQSELQAHSAAIGLLRLQKRQLEARKMALNRPEGMIAGLWVFGLFALICVIAPIMLTPFATENYSCYLTIKLIAIGLFTAGMLAIFIFLVSLMRWKNAKKED